MVLVAVLLGLGVGGAVDAHADWTVLARGLEFRWLAAPQVRPGGTSRIAVVRADPTSWQLELVGRSRAGDPGRTAREWAAAHGLAVAINAGMFGQDHRTHVGYLEVRGEVRSRRVNAYRSVAAFDPRDPESAGPPSGSSTWTPRASPWRPSGRTTPRSSRTCGSSSGPARTAGPRRTGRGARPRSPRTGTAASYSCSRRRPFRCTISTVPSCPPASAWWPRST